MSSQAVIIITVTVATTDRPANPHAVTAHPFSRADERGGDRPRDPAGQQRGTVGHGDDAGNTAKRIQATTHGRPGKDPQDVKAIRLRYRLTWALHMDQINMQRHTLSGDGANQTFVTQLTPLQCQIANWFPLSLKKYGV